MKLEWLEKSGHTADGDKFHRYYLIDEESGRVMGVVEPPSGDELCFWADPDEGHARRYLAVEPAQNYLVECALRDDQDDSSDLGKLFTTDDKPKDASIATDTLLGVNPPVQR